MLLTHDQYYLNNNNDVEFLFERPIGWSSACLDSTISYYLNCSYNHLDTDEDINTNKNNE